jgi:hypothetical protein
VLACSFHFDVYLDYHPVQEYAVFERILNQLREKVRTRQYVMTLHANEEMDEDGLTIFDVESVILSGIVIERQKDSTGGEWKYIVKGESLAGEPVFTVTKLGPTGKLVFITVFRE